MRISDWSSDVCSSDLLGFYIAGVSKTVSPGLCTGYIVAPERALGRVGSAVHSTCWMACPLTAEIAAELIRSGVARQVAEGRKREAEARSKIARESFAGWDFDCSAGANFLWLRLPEPWRSSDRKRTRLNSSPSCASRM